MDGARIFTIGLLIFNGIVLWRSGLHNDAPVLRLLGLLMTDAGILIAALTFGKGW